MCTKNSDNIYIKEFWTVDKIKVKYTNKIKFLLMLFNDYSTKYLK